MTEAERQTLRSLLNATRRAHMADPRYDYKPPWKPRTYPPRAHPSESSWSNHGCRCDGCVAAASQARRARRSRR